MTVHGRSADKSAATLMWHLNPIPQPLVKAIRSSRYGYMYCTLIIGWNLFCFFYSKGTVTMTSVSVQ